MRGVPREMPPGRVGRRGAEDVLCGVPVCATEAVGEGLARGECRDVSGAREGATKATSRALKGRFRR